MDKLPGLLSVFAVIATLSAYPSVVGLAQVNVPDVDPRNPAIASQAASQGRCVTGEPYGVSVSAGTYLVNFLLLYIANPSEAANLPAYRAAIPLALSDCLKENPEGCPYAEFANSFDNPDFNNRCLWPTQCQTDPKWEHLAPRVARQPDQINEPLGMSRAKSLARQLGIDDSMILTDAEYQCTIGTPPRNPNQQTIFQCIHNLTNSKGNAEIPLSSYGLSLTDRGDVQSVCAPQAPCLVFNNLFAGPLEKIAAQCGWARKLEDMVRETPFPELVADGHECQQFGGAPTGACIVGNICKKRQAADKGNTLIKMLHGALVQVRPKTQ